MDVDRQRVYSRDPFAVDPLPRAHYYPSPEKKLSRDQKRTAISPQRQPEAEKPAASTRIVDESRLSPMDEIFLRNTNSYQSKMTSHYKEVEDNDEKFDESWPSSERPSSMNLTCLEEESPVNLERFQATVDRFTDLKKTLAFPDHASPGTSPQLPRRAEQMGAKRDAGRKPAGKPGISGKSQIPVREKGKPKVPTGGDKDSMKIQEDTGGGSVLQRYIERFRNSAPLSREERERQKESKAEDFWWLSSGSPPAPQTTQTREERGGGKGSETVTPLTTVNLDKYSNLQKLRHDGYQKSSQLPGSPSDRRTKELQDRAEKLLERSSSTVLSTEPAVSTEGLGSNTSGMSSLEEYSYRPKFAGLIDEEGPRSTANPYTYKSDIPPRRVVPTRPEDDPLHQWRLRRRMEQAQETAPKVAQSFGFLTKTEQQKKLDSQLEDFKRKLAGKDVQTKAPAPGYQFTPAPGMEQVREGEPQIASPVLHRKKPQTETEVDPHLHLMCDLLPCPHRGMYSDMLGNVRTDDSRARVHKDMTQGNVQSDDFRKEVNRNMTQEMLQQAEIERHQDLQVLSKEKSKSDEKEREFIEFEMGKRKQSEDRVKDKLDNKENELFLEIEKLNKEQGKDGGKYKQFLEAEKPDVEKSDSERSLNSDRSRKSDKVVKSDSDRSLKSDRSNVSDSSMKSERSRKDMDKRRKKTDKETADVINSDLSKSDQKDFGRSSKDERQLRPQDKRSSRRENESEEPSNIGQRSDDKGQRSDDERSKSQGRKEKLRPRLSSSPVRNVEAAIGQVVKNHLFSMSTSTILSSVDSLPPTVSVEGLPRVPEHTTEDSGSRLSPAVSMEVVGRAPEHTPDEPGTSQEPGVTKATDESAVYESDGDFEDDDLLLMLRKQRDQYELKLRKIDACLANLDHR